MSKKTRRRPRAAQGPNISDALPSEESAARCSRTVDAREGRDGAPSRCLGRPPFVRRCIAFAIDWYVGSVLTSLPLMAALFLLDAPDPAVPDVRQLPFGAAATSVAFGCLLACLYYVVVPLKWSGFTVGKRLCGIRIVKADTSDLTLGDLVLRQIVGTMMVEGSVFVATSLVLQVVFWAAPDVRRAVILVQYGITAVSALMVVMSRRRTALHDVLARTEVVAA